MTLGHSDHIDVLEVREHLTDGNFLLEAVSGELDLRKEVEWIVKDAQQGKVTLSAAEDPPLIWISAM